MDKTSAAYAAYMIFFLILSASPIIVPLLAFSQDMGWAYDAFAPTCHQKMSRSLCVFNSEGGGYWIADCTEQGGGYVSDHLDRKAVRVERDGAAGYKMPFCSRDFGIYAAMLIAGALYPFVRRLDSRAMYPAIYLLLAMVPIALDGGLQLASEIDEPLFGFNILPFEYESTNMMRLLTGAIAGFAASFYAIPVLVNVFSPGYDAAPAPREKTMPAMAEPPAMDGGGVGSGPKERGRRSAGKKAGI